MKKYILAAAVVAISALGAVEASAQYHREPGRGGPRWEGGHGAPPSGAWRFGRPHGWCMEKARRLHDFERLAASDGRVSRGEHRIADQLRADLRASCGGGRWHPERGWHH